jgi:hypothetical protein
LRGEHKRLKGWEARLDQLEGLLERMATHVGVEPRGLVFQSRLCGDASACARDAAATRTIKPMRELHRDG